MDTRRRLGVNMIRMYCIKSQKKYQNYIFKILNIPLKCLLIEKKHSLDVLWELHTCFVHINYTSPHSLES